LPLCSSSSSSSSCSLRETGRIVFKIFLCLGGRPPLRISYPSRSLLWAVPTSCLIAKGRLHSKMPVPFETLVL
jgi:hypothetical protein